MVGDIVSNDFALRFCDGVCGAFALLYFFCYIHIRLSLLMTVFYLLSY